jgi:hypothetical protein
VTVWRGWGDNINMEIEEMGLELLEWIHLTKKQGQVVSCCGLSNEPSESIKCIKFL